MCIRDRAQARQNPQNAPDEADDDGFHDELHTDAAVPVSYTHLDVYKRQAPASGRRPERLVLRPYSRYFFPFLRRNMFTNSAKVHAAAPKPSTCLLYTSRCV